jgi:two-component system cell cycle sensor histidine kinase/response regulator CckA
MSVNDSEFYATSNQVRSWILWLAAASALLAVASSLYIGHAFRQKHRALQAQHELREQLMQTQKTLMLGQLSGGVAHDFNNILGAVQLQLSVLSTVQQLNSDAAKVVQECSRTINSGSALTAQLLNFSRKNPANKTTLALAELLRENTAMLQRLLGRRYELVWNVDPESLKITADVSMFQQVILNLVLNARDAMPDGGSIRVEARPHTLTSPRNGTTKYVRIDVSDDGAGMPPEVKARIFEPFFTTKTAGKGTGLGLSTTIRIVRDHQGWIEVDSVVGKGSRFSVFLPEA